MNAYTMSSCLIERLESRKNAQLPSGPRDTADYGCGGTPTTARSNQGRASALRAATERGVCEHGRRHEEQLCDVCRGTFHPPRLRVPRSPGCSVQSTMTYILAVARAGVAG